jgi:hypothetical protein
MIDAPTELMAIAEATLNLNPPSRSRALSERLLAIAKHLRAERIVREACEVRQDSEGHRPGQLSVYHAPER